MDQRRRRLALIAYAYRRFCRRRFNRRWWVHPINLQRDTAGAWHSIIQEFREHYPDKHKELMRVSIKNFQHILPIVKPLIQKKDTLFRKTIKADERLAVTLVFLATGDSFKTLALQFRMGQSTVRDIIYSTCAALWKTLKPIYLNTRKSAEEWKEIADGFKHTWNFPNCVGAIDGKHCAIVAPDNSGSENFNYKKHFSIVLMAMCDSAYRFTYVDVGAAGRWSDGGTFDHCSLNEAITRGGLPLPQDQPLPGTDRPSLPHVIVGDEAFPLRPWLLRPYPGRELDRKKRMFNMRLSRARRTIENAFGIMVARWRCLRRTLHVSEKHAVLIVSACCVLHNYMRTERVTGYIPARICDMVDDDEAVVDSVWQDVPTNAVNRNHPVAAAEVRDAYADFFSGTGSLQWQDAYVNRVQ